MTEDIKQLKEQEKQEVLEDEAKDIKSGKLDLAEVSGIVETPVEETAAPATVDQKPAFKGGSRRFGGPPARTGQRRGGEGGGGRGGRRGGRRETGEKDEFEQKIIDLARVTRVMAGGKRMRFRACVAIGDRAGRVAIGLAKGQDVTVAISKAVTQAKKDIITVPLINETIPFEVREKYKAARIIFKPAKQGKGIIAGGAVREVLALAGVPNVVAKMMGSNNKVTNVKATMLALKRLANSRLVKKAKTVKVEVKSEGTGKTLEPSK